MLIEELLDDVSEALSKDGDQSTLPNALEGKEVQATGIIKATSLSKTDFLRPRVAITLRPAWQREVKSVKLQCKTLTVFVADTDVADWATCNIGEEVVFTFILEKNGPSPCFWIDRAKNVILSCGMGRINRGLVRVENENDDSTRDIARSHSGAVVAERQFTTVKSPSTVTTLPWTIRKLSRYLDVQHTLAVGKELSQEKVNAFWNQVETQVLSIEEKLTIRRITANLTIESGELLCTIELTDPEGCICVCLAADEPRFTHYLQQSLFRASSRNLVEQVWNIILPPTGCPFTKYFFSYASQLRCSNLYCMLDSDDSEQVVYKW